MQRRYSSGGNSSTLKILPNINATLSKDPQFLPSVAQVEHPSNKIKSTRYNAFSFLPIALFLQYKKVVVGFYTFNVIMQSIPAVSTNSPLASLIPVLFIIFVGILKEAYLEYKRWKSDKEINEAPCSILRGVRDKELVFEPSQVQEIVVGEILRLQDGDYVPADCIVLRASQSNG